MASMLYATDGQCHNAEPGTYGHECGKPATWLGTDRNGFVSGFCDDCRQHGWERTSKVAWIRLPAILDAASLEQWGQQAAALAREARP